MSTVERLLSDMLAAIERIERYAHAVREMFDSNELVRGWIEHQLILLGEAARRVGEPDRSYQDAHPDVPWGQLVGMRNILIHQYHRVDPEIVWTAVVRDLPPLRAVQDTLRTLELQRSLRGRPSGEQPPGAR